MLIWPLHAPLYNFSVIRITNIWLQHQSQFFLNTQVWWLKKTGFRYQKIAKKTGFGFGKTQVRNTTYTCFKAAVIALDLNSMACSSILIFSKINHATQKISQKQVKHQKSLVFTWQAFSCIILHIIYFFFPYHTNIHESSVHYINSTYTKAIVIWKLYWFHTFQSSIISFNVDIFCFCRLSFIKGWSMAWDKWKKQNTVLEYTYIFTSTWIYYFTYITLWKK